MKNFIQCISILFFTSACTQYSHGPISTAWHNLNAKYNSLIIARTDYKYADENLSKYSKENYSKILPIFVDIDSMKLDSAKYLLNDAIKKTSLIAERHSNSKHLDEAYIILGKARLKKGEFFNAIETFKYVNTKSKSRDHKNEALIWLFRSYIENEDLISANQVANVLANEPLSNFNKALFLQTKAYYYQKQNEDALALVFLEESQKYTTRNQARVNFIIGQYYDKLNNSVMAKKYYRYALNSRPSYDLEFNAKMGLKLNESLAYDSNSLFEDMLDDRKNQDMLDKIYYKMGELESQKKNYAKAIQNFSKSAQLASKDLVQKAYSYKAIGDIYFEKLNQVQNGANYYDSTLISIPKSSDEYKTLSQKAMVYNDFIKYYKVNQLEDSLQRLAKLNTDDLNIKLTSIAKQRIEAENAKKAPIALAAISEKKWLFYDNEEYIRSKSDFIRLWGNRELEDNWRRGNKSVGSSVSKLDKVVNKENSNLKSLKDADSEMAKRVEMERLHLLSRVPSTPLQLEASRKMQEEAQFQLGKIYKIQFNDLQKSKKAFEQFVSNFPNSTYEPEALYFLSIESGADSPYKSQLLSKYPNSSFSRQLQKGITQITKDSESEAQKLYANAFDLFEKNDFVACQELLDKGLSQYLGNQVEDKMAMLRILTLSKINTKEQYLTALNDFVRSYPSSELLPRVQQLLASINTK